MVNLEKNKFVKIFFTFVQLSRVKSTVFAHSVILDHSKCTALGVCVEGQNTFRTFNFLHLNLDDLK